jgi:cyclopropane fatty-acyl-phospholipid synthase-like methyltransferase
MPEPNLWSDGPKRHAPATFRNREPIRDTLATLLPSKARVLEVGAGTGEHAVFFSRALPHLTWQPTDADPELIASIAAYAMEADLPNLRPPLMLDAGTQSWQPALADKVFDAVVSINMIHIAPWCACAGLIAGAAAVLRQGGLLILYGPFMVDGRHTAPSNAAFDHSLKAMDARFGVRDVAEVVAAAPAFRLTHRLPMPANNLTLVFARDGDASQRTG